MRQRSHNTPREKRTAYFMYLTLFSSGGGRRCRSLKVILVARARGFGVDVVARGVDRCRRPGCRRPDRMSCAAPESWRRVSVLRLTVILLVFAGVGGDEGASPTHHDHEATIPEMVKRPPHGVAADAIDAAHPQLTRKLRAGRKVTGSDVRVDVVGDLQPQQFRTVSQDPTGSVLERGRVTRPVPVAHWTPFEETGSGVTASVTAFSSARPSRAASAGLRSQPGPTEVASEAIHTRGPPSR